MLVDIPLQKNHERVAKLVVGFAKVLHSCRRRILRTALVLKSCDYLTLAVKSARAMNPRRIRKSNIVFAKNGRFETK